VFTKDEELGWVMDITMLGPRGVGKTSLLVSLYDQFQAVAGGRLALTPADLTTRVEMQAYRESLRAFARGYDHDPGIAGNARIRTHLFGFGTPGRVKPEMTLRFTDIPGGLLTQAVATTETAMLDRALRRSGVIFLAVDSPALMEVDGQYNEETNKPDHVTEFVRDALVREANRLIVLVPLKCEKYVATEQGTLDLVAKLEKSYAQLINEATRRGAAVVITPVQTVGSMRFSMYEIEHGQHRAVFRLARTGVNTYTPKDNDQPVRWMLRFALNAYRKRPRWFGEILADWRRGIGPRLDQELRRFSMGSKVNDGFKIVVRHDYLAEP